MINLWVKCLCLLVSVISSTKHKYLLPCYAPKGCRSQKEAESSEKVSIFHGHLCIMYVWCAVVRPRCIHRLSLTVAEVLVWDAVPAVCPCEPPSPPSMQEHALLCQPSPSQCLSLLPTWWNRWMWLLIMGWNQFQADCKLPKWDGSGG